MRFIKAFTKDTPLCNAFITKARTSVQDNSSASKALEGRKVLVSYIIFKDIFNNIIAKELLEDINVFYQINLELNISPPQGPLYQLA